VPPVGLATSHFQMLEPKVDFKSSGLCQA
jgi:hypothetical protein